MLRDVAEIFSLTLFLAALFVIFGVLTGAL